MLRKSARILIGLAIVEIAFLALAVSMANVPIQIAFLLVAAGTVTGVLLSMRLISRLVTGSSAGRRGAPSAVGLNATTVSPGSAGDAALRGLGGLLMIFPGLLTGAVGLLLMIPPVRAALRPMLWKRIEGLIPAELRTLTDVARNQQRGFGRGPGGRDVVDVDVASAGADRPGNPSSSTHPELG